MISTLWFATAIVTFTISLIMLTTVGLTPEEHFRWNVYGYFFLILGYVSRETGE
jgi:hypothetical protein